MFIHHYFWNYKNFDSMDEFLKLMCQMIKNKNAIENVNDVNAWWKPEPCVHSLLNRL